MHIVVLAWLFVILTMSLTLTPGAGVALFALAGIAPVALLAALAARRARRRDAAGSVLEREVRERDDGEAEPDRR